MGEIILITDERYIEEEAIITPTPPFKVAGSGELNGTHFLVFFDPVTGETSVEIEPPELAAVIRGSGVDFTSLYDIGDNDPLAILSDFWGRS